MALDLIPIQNWLPNYVFPLIMAGPCSAESESQVLATAKALEKFPQVKIFRAGVWKPRTSPGHFEGAGEIALTWLKKVKEQTGLLTTVEVSTAKHAEAALKAGVDILWIGARTTVNPFYVQEIAEVLKGSDIPVFVKNPINPELSLWIGALERFNRMGIRKLAAIHRGFSVYEKTVYRYPPFWEIPMELKRLFPQLPIICDPSHISGKKDLLAVVAQKALTLGMHGLMIETHIHPERALSDAQQQIEPSVLGEMIESLQQIPMAPEHEALILAARKESNLKLLPTAASNIPN